MCTATIGALVRDTTGAVLDILAPTITSSINANGTRNVLVNAKVVMVNPVDLATGVPISNSVNVTFDEAIDPLSISTANFTMA